MHSGLLDGETHQVAEICSTQLPAKSWNKHNLLQLNLHSFILRCTRACVRAHGHVCAVTGNAELRTPGILNALSLGHISCPLKQTLDPYVCHTIPPCESTSHETAIFSHLWLTDNGDSTEF